MDAGGADAVAFHPAPPLTTLDVADAASSPNTVPVVAGLEEIARHRPELRPPTVERVLTLDVLAQRENVIVAPHGLGKTNLVYEAILAGHSAAFSPPPI